MKGLRAKDESRTRDLNLGKVALYQLSYFRLYFQFFLVSNSDQNPPAGGLRSTPDSYREATFAYIFNFSGLELRPKSARWRIALYSR
jgi:hypothetical protein